MLAPDVVGFELTGALPAGVTATDMTLRIVEMLREHGVVGRFVEFHGAGMEALSLADRATIANMAPEYGATCGFFPVDGRTLEYLRLTAARRHVARVEAYAKAQGLWYEPDAPVKAYSSHLTLDLNTVKVASMAGPKRPQDRIDLDQMKPRLRDDAHRTAWPQRPWHPRRRRERPCFRAVGWTGACVMATSSSPPSRVARTPQS